MIGARQSCGVAVVASEQREQVARWDVQRPRVFYRREPEVDPMVVAKGRH